MHLVQPDPWVVRCQRMLVPGGSDLPSLIHHGCLLAKYREIVQVVCAGTKTLSSLVLVAILAHGAISVLCYRSFVLRVGSDG